MINFELIESRDALTTQFENASPFPHAVIDDFVSNGVELLREFPDEDWPHWRSLGDVYQRNKFTCSDISKIPHGLQSVLIELGSPRFLKWLESVTGINGLIPDPYLEGGGLHLSLGGGQLAPHTDFHVYERLKVYRRLNLIIYLTDSWQPGDGGELELSIPGDLTPLALVEPLMGRGILFETTDTSVHGFRNLVRDGTRRPSIAVYYYTSSETPGFSGDQTTHWRDHGKVSRLQMPRFLIYKLLMKLSRVFSIAAHIFNPNQGLGLVKSRIKNRG